MPCPVHVKVPWAGSTRQSRLPSQWRDKRARILRRDRRICYLCGQAGATEVDHVVPGDDHRDLNLAAVHPACHARKSGQEGAQVRNQPRFY